MRIFKESELILNPDGSVYHLSLRPEHIADTVILVGDQDRVKTISDHFSKVEFSIQNREFRTHTGLYRGERITVMSTGIGTDNIDIVINELDAAVNIDLEKRILKEKPRVLNLIRLGTSGALQEDIPVDTFVASEYGLGFDGLLHFYSYDPGLTESEMSEAFVEHSGWGKRMPYPYIVRAAGSLIGLIAQDMTKGVTATANGFFGPQGRELRIPLALPDLNDKMASFSFGDKRITNFEMETSALYALGRILGHNTLTVCDIIANRARREYSSDYKKSVNEMIALVLERISKS